MNKFVEDAKAILSGEKKLPLKELAFLIENLAFTSYGEKENIDLANKLLKMLMSMVDQDDDDEVEYVFKVIDHVLKNDKDADALELFEETGISFTEPRYYQHEMTNFRDYILKWAFSLEVVKKMSQLGVDLNEALIKGKTPVYILADRNRMISFGREDPEEEFAKAMKFFSTDSMEALNMQGTSAVHAAIKNNHFEMVEAMINEGIDVNITEDQPNVAGTTLLHTACAYGFPKIVQMLMDAGADDTIKNVEDETAAHIAVSVKVRFKKIEEEDRAKMLKALKNIDIAGKNGRTPLILAQNLGINEANVVTPVFIEKGADVNHADDDGNTALILQADKHCYKETMKMLINAGADVNARNKYGNTPLHLALMERRGEVARILIKKGADYNVANEKKVTPVEIAVENGLDEVLPLMGL